jgi:hypothetical protein
VNPAVVVKRDVNRHGRCKVLDPLRERLGEPREPFAPLANRPGVPLDVRGAYRGDGGYPVHVVPIGFHEIGGSVPADFRVDVVFDQNAMLHGSPEGIADRRDIGVPAVRANQRAVLRTILPSPPDYRGSL